MSRELQLLALTKLVTFLEGYNVKCYVLKTNKQKCHVLCIQYYNTNVKWY